MFLYGYTVVSFKLRVIECCERGEYGEYAKDRQLAVWEAHTIKIYSTVIPICVNPPFYLISVLYQFVKKDVCGVCGGDGSSCTFHSEVYQLDVPNDSKSYISY